MEGFWFKPLRVLCQILKPNLVTKLLKTLDQNIEICINKDWVREAVPLTVAQSWFCGSQIANKKRITKSSVIDVWEVHKYASGKAPTLCIHALNNIESHTITSYKYIRLSNTPTLYVRVEKAESLSWISLLILRKDFHRSLLPYTLEY